MTIATLRPPLLLLFSRVYFAVKRKRPTVNAALVLLASLLGKKSASIVLADDDPEDREIFLEVISEVVPHVNVTIAKNGKELMKLLLEKEEVPDILFLDLNMPFKNGQECLVEIRNSDKLKNIPVIIYSTSRSREHIDETFMSGANFYFPKPDSFRDLKTMISRIFALDWDDLMKPRKDKFILSVNQFRL
jgi:CheY-like chemotaxis protein